jgi:hypothetical protein
MNVFQKIFYVSIALLAISATALAQYDSLNVTLIGRWPVGGCRTAFANGNYVCVGNGTCMDVLDVSDPDTAIFAGRVITESIVSGIHVSGNYAYIANWSNGLRVIDISNPNAPTEVAFLPFEGQCWDVSVFGNFAYVGNDTLGLRIVDISAPTLPFLVGTFAPPGFAGAEYTQVIDTLAYMASKDGLYILDISTPASPLQIGYSPSPTGSYHVNVANNVAYLPEFASGVRMVDVTDSYNPTEIGYFDTPGSASWIEVSGNYAYVADGDAGLYVLNVTVPSLPDSVVLLDTEDAYAFNIQGNYLYLAARAVGFKIIDISNPTSPLERGFCDTGGYQLDVYVSNNFIFATQGQRGLSVIDITAPNSPTEVATLDMENAAAIHGSGDYLYVVDDGDLWIINVSDPGSPQQVGFWEPGWVSVVFVSGNYAYLGGFPDLRILDVSNPNTPVEVGVLDGLPGYPRGIYVSGNYAYLANAWGGLRIINLSNPSAPNEEGYFDAVDNVRAVHVSGSYAYLADRWVGLLRVINISTPSAPFEVITVYTQEARDVYLSGDYAYVINSWTGVRVIDVSDPLNPFEAGFFDTGGYANAVYFDHYIYVADGGGGLYILQNDLISAINDETVIPFLFSLNQNYPNPFNPVTTIRYGLPKSAKVVLKIYNALGQEILTLVDETQTAGEKSVVWDSRDRFGKKVSSGIYFYRLEASDAFTSPTKGKADPRFVQSRKMVLLK